MTVNGETKDGERGVLLALFSSVANGIVVVLVFLGFLQIPGRELDRLLWFDTMAIFTFIFPWLNIAAAPLALFSSNRPRLRAWTWYTAAGGALFVVYLVVVLFVTY